MKLYQQKHRFLSMFLVFAMLITLVPMDVAAGTAGNSRRGEICKEDNNEKDNQICCEEKNSSRGIRYKGASNGRSIGNRRRFGRQ